MFNPKLKLLKVVFGVDAFTNDPLPETTDQDPAPAEGVLPASNTEADETQTV
jgi:hypothetical protein